MNTPTIMTMPIIGHHHSPLSQKFGIPRQPNLVDVASEIHFLPPYDRPDAFVGIERYSHLWVFWQFHHNKPQTHFRPQVRPPRFGGNDKIGVFASRSMYRPSSLGLSVVALHSVQIVNHQVILHIQGADMVDGTPIVDIKPYLPFADSIKTATSDDIDTPVIRRVVLSQQATLALLDYVHDGVLDYQDGKTISQLIAQDPRPAYRQHEVGVLFVMRYKSVDVGFFMNQCDELVIDKILTVN